MPEVTTWHVKDTLPACRQLVLPGAAGISPHEVHAAVPPADASLPVHAVQVPLVLLNPNPGKHDVHLFADVLLPSQFAAVFSCLLQSFAALQFPAPTPAIEEPFAQLFTVQEL
jgi:hypothetical protein